MLAEFWKATAGKLADRWAAAVAPAIVFWGAVVLAWAHAGSGWSRLTRISDWLNKQQVASQVAALIGALVVVAASVIVVQRLTDPVLRALEGYWPAPLAPVAYVFRKFVQWRKARDDQKWQALQKKIEGMEPTAGQLARQARLDRRRRCRPVLDNELLPTRIGNILRAAETRPRHRYGLDVMLIWPRLWLILPETARSELGAARSSLNASVAAVIWGTAFAAFTFPFLKWWSLVALTIPFLAIVWWVPARAEVFAELIRSSVELYRVALYNQLRWPLPDNPQEEPECGKALTKYLEQGSDQPEPQFTAPTRRAFPPAH